jgi:hypothetical protein
LVFAGLVRTVAIVGLSRLDGLREVVPDVVDEWRSSASILLKGKLGVSASESRRRTTNDASVAHEHGDR